MSSQAQRAERPNWQQIFDLGERLAAQPTIAAQHHLIVETAARLVEGQADLWLAEAFRWLPSVDKLPLLSLEASSDLARRAFEEKRLSRGGEAGLKDALAVAVPLAAHDAALGVLEVRRPEGPPFGDAEIELLRGLAIQSAIALQAARQIALERWRTEQLSLVREVSGQVTDILSLDELAQRVTNLVLETFDYYCVNLFILEPDQETLRARASAGQPGRGELPLSLQVRLGEGIVGHAAQDGEEILANDVSQEPRYRYVDMLPETRSEVGLPLKIEDRVLGVLDVQGDQRDAFSETDMLVLRALADQVAIAVEDSRLYGAARRRADQLATVAEVSRAVASILDLDELLDRVVNLIGEKFGYPFVHLLTLDTAREQIVYRAGSGPRGKELQEQGLACGLEGPETIVPWVACHGEPVLVNDLSHDSRYLPSQFSEINALSELAVPLIFGGKVLGVLDVQSDRRGAFVDDDRFLLGTLADSVAIAVRNASLYRSERWRRQVADSLREVAGLLSTNAGLDQVLDAILTELERTLPCDAAAIWLVENDNLCLSAVHGYEAEMCIADFSPGGPWLTQALSADQAAIRTSESPPEPLGVAMGFPPDYSAIAVPLRAGDQRLGLLTLAHRAPGRYGTESQAMMAAFASYAAVAIENTRLYQETQELARISTVMLKVAEATRALTSLDAVLEIAVNLLSTMVDTDRCAILLWDEPAAAFVPAAATGLSPEQQAAFEQWRIAPGDEPAFDDLRRDKAPVFIYDVVTDDRLAGVVAWTLGFESLLLLPLLAQGEVLGTLLIDYQEDWAGTGGLESFRDERLTIIQGVAHQTAVAVENAQLRERQQEEAYVSAALLQVAQAVASLNDLDDILSTIVRIIPILVGVERCVVLLWDEERAVFCPAHSYGIPRDVWAVLEAQRYAPGDFVVLDAVREYDHLVVYPPGAPDREGEQVPSGFSAGFRMTSTKTPGEAAALLVLPLSVKGDVLGVMVLEETGLPSHSRDRRQEIVTGIAQQAALAIQGDRLQQEMAERERLERELQLAHEIQQTFMPGQPPEVPGWELAFAWRAARQVAGDFYDFFELPGGQWGLVIADVADKGMPAALFMALTRTLMRAAALEEPSPAAALARVNDLLVPDAQRGMFVTLFYAVLSLETDELTYANAGHNLPLLLRAGAGQVEQLSKGGMALGVLEGNQLEEHVVSLEPDDCLVLYTDGITEAFSPEGEIYGEERLHAMIRAAAGGPAQAMLDAIDDSVAAFIGDGAPSDDRTFMVLRRLK